jgi:hypothetical protein
MNQPQTRLTQAELDKLVDDRVLRARHPEYARLVAHVEESTPPQAAPHLPRPRAPVFGATVVPAHGPAVIPLRTPWWRRLARQLRGWFA